MHLNQVIDIIKSDKKLLCNVIDGYDSQPYLIFAGYDIELSTIRAAETEILELYYADKL